MKTQYGKTSARHQPTQLLLLLLVLVGRFAGQPASSQEQATRLRLQQAAGRARLDWQASLRGPGEQTDAQQQQQQQQQQYRCAEHCDCSLVQVSRPAGQVSNVSLARCQSARFTDLLTIDRRTQIIHISLPQAAEQPQASRFRMPRLVQFGSLREIVIINLRFEVCDSEVFKRGQRLRRLQLNHNGLQRLTKACLRHLERLIELNLDHNRLAELESALFSNLLSLRSLSLAHNQLTELAAHQFANLTYLSALNLEGNAFRTINLHLLEPMQNSLRLLLLAGNQIKTFAHTPPAPPAASSKLSRPASQLGVAFRKLVKLDVSRNKLERIKSLQLHRFYNVKFLALHHNQIAAIRDKAFNGLKLTELSLAANGLQSLSRCAFCNSTIRRLVLASNNISLAAPSLLLADALPQPHALAAPDPPTSEPPAQAQDTPPAASSSQNLLILSQSLLGPLFGQLEYLDVSWNFGLGEQLEPLLEPLLKLEYLQLAGVGLDRVLPSPTLFKNLRQLRYLNLSHNQLDQLVAESVEPLEQLQALDLSYNKFNELDESLLVALDEKPALKLLNLADNPWFCSQCKVAPLYDWILRSPIYNASCLAPAAGLQEADAADDGGDDEEAAPDEQQAAGDGHWLALGAHDDKTLEETLLDFDLIGANQSASDLLANYRLLAANGSSSPTGWLGLAREPPLAGQPDDSSVGQVMELTQRLASSASSLGFQARQFCLRCEFPGELRGLQLHELAPADFKFCPGAAPRFSASEPRIGLTLAIVIIGALFCIIVVVIVMYRRKAGAYYASEDQDQLEQRRPAGQAKRLGSSEAEPPYADQTDYSSPPMSQSYESYSNEDEQDDEDEELDEVEAEEDEDEDEEEEEEGAGQPDEEAGGPGSAGSSRRQTEVKRPLEAPAEQQASGWARRQSSVASVSAGRRDSVEPRPLARRDSGEPRPPTRGESVESRALGRRESVEPRPLGRRDSGEPRPLGDPAVLGPRRLEPALAISQRRQSSLERSHGRRLAVQSAHTVDPGALGGSAPASSAGGRLAGLRRPPASQLSRQRFAMGGGQESAGSSEGWPPSDATTADSLALEFAAEPVEAQLAELEAGGLLVAGSQEELGAASLAEQAAGRLRASTHSNRSALTQTSSQELAG